MSVRIKFIIIVLFLILSNCVDKSDRSMHGSRPNIIFILADDMSYFDLGFLGQKAFQTPNIDYLAENGLFFSEAYAGAPECAPSRASLMTGMHQGHCRIRLNSSARGQENLLDSDMTVAELLKQAGYKTGFTGKWGIGLPGTEGIPEKQGFDYAFGFYGQARAHTYYPHYLMENGKQIPLPGNYGFDMENTYNHSKKTGPLHNYDADGKLIPLGVKDPDAVINSQDMIQSRAIKFIRENQDHPFFLYYAPQLPHGPCITPDLSKYMEKDWDQKHMEWAAMMDHLDRHVGELVSLTRELGIEENTLILFASDNGYSQWGYFGRKPWEDDPVFNNKGPWRGGKFATYDGGMRVPLIAYLPGKIAQGISNQVVCLTDFLATACDLAGIESGKNDGLSFLPLLEGNSENMPQREFLYWAGGTKLPYAQAVRMGKWFGLKESSSSPLQLWNLEADTGCLLDLATGQEEISEKIKDIMRREHVPATWYKDPTETDEQFKVKEKKAREQNQLLAPTRANTTYPGSINKINTK